MRKLTITWAELQAILQKAGNGISLMPNEKIKEITLTKPRQLLIRTEQAEQITK